MKRRGGEPGEQRGVFDRIPGPVATPAEFDVSPLRAQDDADGEEKPGEQRPSPRGVDPVIIPASGGQCADHHGERNREAGIAEEQQRRMGDHRGILKHGIQPVSVVGNIR